MKTQSLLFGTLLAMAANSWAVDAPAADTSSGSPPPIPDVELPPAFINAQAIPAPEQSNDIEPPKPPVEILPYQVEVGTSHSSLSNGYGDWSSFYFDAEMKLASRNNIYGSIRRENRYSKTDTEVMGGFYEPINDNFTVVIEGSMSPQYNFLARNSFLAEVEYTGGNGWGGEVGLRHADYSRSDLNLVNMTVERSWGNYRAAYTYYHSFLLGSGQASSNQIQGARYYGDHNWVGVTFSSGTELESLPAALVRASQVRAVVVSGLHWYKPKIGLTYTLGNYNQGTFYTRNGLQVGLRYQF